MKKSTKQAATAMLAISRRRGGGALSYQLTRQRIENVGLVVITPLLLSLSQLTKLPELMATTAFEAQLELEMEVTPQLVWNLDTTCAPLMGLCRSVVEEHCA